MLCIYKITQLNKIRIFHTYFHIFVSCLLISFANFLFNLKSVPVAWLNFHKLRFSAMFMAQHLNSNGKHGYLLHEIQFIVNMPITADSLDILILSIQQMVTATTAWSNWGQKLCYVVQCRFTLLHSTYTILQLSKLKKMITNI